MTKKELINRISINHNLTLKDSELLIDSVFEEIINSFINNEDVKIKDFGSFNVKINKKRKGINPYTLEKIEIEESKVVKFKMSKTLKEKISSEEKYDK